jgi:hypothetical protein
MKAIVDRIGLAKLEAQLAEKIQQEIAAGHQLGIPNVFMKDGVIYRHYADGQLEPIHTSEI